MMALLEHGVEHLVYRYSSTKSQKFLKSYLDLNEPPHIPPFIRYSLA